MSNKSECVKVVVRCRPMLENEIAAGFSRVVEMAIPRGMVMLRNPKARRDEPLREFTFDAIYDWNSRQVDLYDETFRPIVDAVLEGYNGTIFAYGQTGTGKTYTMEGERNNPSERGVIPSSFEHIFTHIARTHDEQYLVRASYLEIYQEEIRDLLSKDHKRKLELRERPDTGVYVQDLSSFVAKSVREIEHVMNVGNQNRSVGPTNMNEHSSRSHAIFIVTVECSAQGTDGEDHIRVGKLNLVDLAGSERQAKTESTGDRFKEATKINLSLSALGNVISALVDGKSSYIPYRDSKLTRLLQDSLGGNAKTVMVANIGPANYNYDETLTTLRYANRAKNIKNKPHINEDPKDALLREYQEEILRLKTALDKRKTKKGGKGSRKRVTSSGEESGGEDVEERGEVSLKAQQEQLEAEKQAIMQNKELLEGEREKLVSEVQHRADLLKKEQKKRDALTSKIKAMESKLLAGGKNIMDRTDEQQKALEKQRQEMIEQKRREREIVQQLEAKEESALEVRETYTSLQEEVDLKTKKLNKLQSKLKVARAEMADYKEEQGRVREELVVTVEELQKELKLRTLLVQNFIPPEDVDRISKRAFYDEDTDEWSLQPIATPGISLEVIPRPVSSVGFLRPMSTFAKVAARTGDPRYVSENILKVELDMPNRTTRDYEGPLVAPLVQAALDAALQEEEEITVDACTVPLGPGTASRPKASRNKARLRQHLGPSEVPQNPTEQFPSSRGLVSPNVRFA